MPAVSSTTSHRQPSNATDNFSWSDFPSLSCRSYIWRRCSLGHQRRHRHSSATWSRDGVHLLSRLSPFSWPSPPHRPPSNGDLLHPVLVFTFITKHPVVQQYTVTHKMKNKMKPFNFEALSYQQLLPVSQSICVMRVSQACLMLLHFIFYLPENLEERLFFILSTRAEKDNESEINYRWK